MEQQKVTNILVEYFPGRGTTYHKDEGNGAVPFMGGYVIWHGDPVTEAEVLAKEAEYDALEAVRENERLWRPLREKRDKLFKAASWALGAVMNDAPGLSVEDKAAWAAWQTWWMDATDDFASPEAAFANEPVPPSPLYTFD